MTKARGRPKGQPKKSRNVSAEDQPNQNDRGAEATVLDNTVGANGGGNPDTHTANDGGSSILDSPTAIATAGPSSGVEDRRVDRLDTKFREQQWEMLGEVGQRYLGKTKEEFLQAEDFTGAGPNSYFTPPEDRLRK